MEKLSTGMILRVGYGRGFVVAGRHDCYVLTAAHCLPKWPPAHPGCCIEEATCENVLGRLNEEPTVWAECLFVDPTGDVAILGAVDSQELYEEANAYEALTSGDGAAFKVADIEGPKEDLVQAARAGDKWAELESLLHPVTPGFLYSLDRKWYSCQLKYLPRGVAVSESVKSGMSGSPIIDARGRAVGLVSCGDFLNPRLMAALPGWFLREIADAEDEDG